MTTYSKLNIVYRLQKWMDSVPGQTFLNYAYSWGASIVILGTLFKLTHLPGANFFLFLGMGTEVFVFFISAFDRPFDKTTDGMALDIHMDEGTEQHPIANGDVLVGSMGSGVQAPAAGGGTIIIGGGGGGVVAGVSSETADHSTGAIGGGVVIGGVIGGGGVVGSGSGVISGVAAVDGDSGVVGDGSVANGGGVVGGSVVGGVIGGGVVAQPEPLPMGEELKEATSNYIDELNRLTEMLTQVSEQSQRLTRDSEEMENLNRTLTGISRVYEMQLKSASSQISTIDEINEQTRHMAEQIQELNKIYARMIEAMQVKANI